MTQKEIDTKFEIAKILVKHLECDTSKVLRPLYDYLQEQLLIHGVSNCDGCGDTGRGEPTLQEPDGVDCEKCSSK